MNLTAYKLGRMRKEELFKIAASMQCEGITAETQRPDLITAIKAKQQKGGPQPVTVQRVPGNPQLFDELTGSTPAGESENTPPADQPGAVPRNPPGRQPGKTNEQCRIDNLSTEPNRTIIYAIKYLFKFWSGLSGCKEIALDEDELKEFAIDTSQFLEYHGILIPQGLAIDGKFIIGGLELIGGRVMILKAHKARMKAAAEKAEKENREKQND